MFVTGGSKLIASQSNALLIEKTPLVNSCENSLLKFNPFLITSFGYVLNTLYQNAAYNILHNIVSHNAVCSSMKTELN